MGKYSSLKGLGFTSPPQYPGFIITGGDSLDKKAEVLNPFIGLSCPLPDLAEEMWGHSHCGNLLFRKQSCLKMNPTGSFSPTSVSLLQKRGGHLCWSLPGGGGEVMLLGGEGSPTTTEIVSADGSSTRRSWDLKYKTQLACGVEVDWAFIVTGGADWYAPDRALNSVVRYNSQGVSEDLPSLTVRRYNHACGSYLDDNGQRVVLVTGGFYRGSKTRNLDSTELMVDFKAWRPAANLPSARAGLRAASLNNKVFLFGGADSSRSYLDSIMFYNKDRDTWQSAGKMTEPRLYHAVAVFPDVSQLCP